MAQPPTRAYPREQKTYRRLHPPPTPFGSYQVPRERERCELFPQHLILMFSCAFIIFPILFSFVIFQSNCMVYFRPCFDIARPYNLADMNYNMIT